MSDRYSILDLSKIVRVARENCILGLYEKALQKYEIAIPTIEERIGELTDASLKEKWKSLAKNLKEEMAEIVEIQKNCEIFKNIYTESGEKKAVNVGGANLDDYPSNQRDEKIQRDADMLRKLQGLEPERKKMIPDKDEDILKNVKMIQNISNQVENKINNIQKGYGGNNNNSNNNNKNNNNWNDKKNQPAQKYTPSSQPSGGGYNNNNNYNRGGGGIWRRWTS